MLNILGSEDSILVAKVLAGDREQFARIVERHLAAAHATAYAYTRNQQDAEDVVQDAFLQAYRSLPELREPGKLGAWLGRIVRNLALNAIARRKRESAVRDAASAGGPRAIEPQVEQREKRALLMRHIEAMEPSASEVLLLHYYAGKSTAEIAAVTGISRHAAKKRLERARKELGDGVLAALVPEARDKEADRTQVRAIMAVLIAPPVTWATPVHAAGVEGWIASVKAAPLTWACGSAAGVALAGVMLIATFDKLPQLLNAPEPVRAAAAPDEARIQVEDESTILASAPADIPEAARDSQGRIEGYVVDAKTGDPVIDAALLLDYEGALPGVDWQPPYAAPTTVSDSNGRFEFTNLGPGVFGLKVEGAAGYPPHQKVVRGEALERGGTLVWRVELHQGVTIAGRVVDEAGQPLAFVGLEGVTNQENMVRSGDSEEDGSFVIPGFQAGGTGFEVRAKKVEYAMAPLGNLTVPPEGLEGLELVMLPESTVDGTVVDELGQAVAGVEVVAWAIEPPVDTWQKRMTDEKGKFSLWGMHPGTYSVWAKDAKENTIDLADESVRVEVAKGEHIDNLVVTMVQEAGLIIEGVVKNVADSVFVRAGVVQVITNQDGQFRLTGLAPGPHKLSFAESGVTRRVKELEDVEAGTTGLEVVFDALASIEGVVIDGATGESIRDFEVTSAPGIHERMTGHHMWQLRERHSTEGEFRIENAVPGDTTIFVRVPGYAPAVVPVQNVAPGAVVSGVTVSLEAGIELAGVVVDAAGAPISGASVFHGHLPEQQMLTHGTSATTDGLGRFAFHVGREEQLAVSAWHPEYASSELLIAANGVSRRDIRLQLGAGGTIRGTAEFVGGGVWGKTVLLLQDGVDRGRTTVDEEGKFQFEHVSPGETEIRLHLDWSDTSKRNFFMAAARVEVIEGEAADVAIRAERGEAAIRGRLVLPMDGLQGEIRIVAGDGDGFALEMTPIHLESGEFFEEGLPAGPCHAVVEKRDEERRIVESREIPMPDLVAGEVVEVDLVVE